MKVKIVMTAIQYMWLLRSLFPPGSSDEHFGCGITGVSTYPGGCNLSLRRFIPADESCLIQQSGDEMPCGGSPNPDTEDVPGAERPGLFSRIRKRVSHLIPGNGRSS